ncbi:MAG: urea ABC transporter ATP-binding protein UrtD [Oscillospiraceae bacterium]|jgi:urea transport system ATP-binding protein|nr:urea ABC transporter ATP-binding protein UrtD [Oscillospiraceae bacterium]
MLPILDFQNVSVSFNGFQAIKNVSTQVMENEIHFFIGPNGAGKTTLLDMACGRTHPSGGHIIFEGTHDLAKMKDYEIAHLGVGRKFQAPSVFPGITVYENLELACTQRHSLYSSMFQRLSGEQRDRLDETLKMTGLYEHRFDYPTRLSHGQKQWLEIGMLFVAKPKLMLLDEPVAGMGRTETERTSELLQKFAKYSTIVVVEHDMEFVRSCSTSVTVLHEGRILDEGNISEVERNPKVIDVYLGRGGECSA